MIMEKFLVLLVTTRHSYRPLIFPNVLVYIEIYKNKYKYLPLSLHCYAITAITAIYVLHISYLRPRNKGLDSPSSWQTAAARQEIKIFFPQTTLANNIFFEILLILDSDDRSENVIDTISFYSV